MIESLERVRLRIARAADRAGRDPDGVTLVAVTKTVPVERIRPFVEAGQTVLGENRVQEALGKIPELPADLRWHLIGHLQRNKARHVAGRFELVHSIDAEEVARELDRRAAAAGIVQAVLVQVRLGGEASKSGISGEDPAAVERLVGVVAGLGNLRARGLMTIPPPVDDPEGSRPWFVRLRELRDRAQDGLGVPLPELSMGMTDDFEVAVEEGATLVRVGRALFGERP